MSGDLNALADLYERDPLSYTTEDIDLIIHRQREAFGGFQAGVKDAGVSKSKKQKTAPDPAKQAAANDLLKNLGLI